MTVTINFKKLFAIFASLVLAVFVLAACDDNGDSSGQDADSKSGQNSYNKQVKQEPAHSMDYPVTRYTVNKWIDRWGKDPNKLSYVYLQNGDGKLTGYFVFKGLPVSYCVSLRPPYHFVGTPDDGNSAKDQQVPAPGADGVYYTGAECNSYYGFDAQTGAYIEYTVGTSQNVLVYDQPLRQNQNVPKLSPTK